MRISEKKKAKVSAAQALLENNEIITAWNFHCLGANRLSDLRLKVSTSNIGMTVLPANLLRTTINRRGIIIPRNTRISGQLLLAFGQDVHSIVSFLRVIGTDKLRFGIERSSKFISSASLVAVSKIPSVNYLRQQLCCLVKLPLLRFVRTLTLATKSATNATVNNKGIAMLTKEELVKCIGSMTALDLCDLAELLKQKFGITTNPEQSSENLSTNTNQNVRQKNSFSIHLDKSGDNKIAVIKVVKEIIGLSLKEAKNLTERAPVMLKDNLSKSQAEELQVKMKAVGAEVTVK